MAAPKRQNIRQNITFRFRIFFIIMLAAFLLLVGNLYKLVFIQGPELREEASSIYIKERMVDATRGNIYSDDGSLLATSLPKYRLGMDPSVYNKSTKAEKLFTAHVRELAEHLANFFKDRTAD
jgi:cell division protein FtsI (penicillin-binding protein 3)